MLNILGCSVYLCLCICFNVDIYIMDVHMDVPWETRGEVEDEVVKAVGNQAVCPWFKEVYLCYLHCQNLAIFNFFLPVLYLGEESWEALLWGSTDALNL